jgi:hypothetical protein
LPQNAVHASPKTFDLPGGDIADDPSTQRKNPANAPASPIARCTAYHVSTARNGSLLS